MERDLWLNVGDILVEASVAILSPLSRSETVSRYVVCSCTQLYPQALRLCTPLLRRAMHVLPADSSVEVENAAADDPPEYEAPPDYEDLVHCFPVNRKPRRKRKYEKETQGATRQNRSVIQLLGGMSGGSIGFAFMFKAKF